MVAVPEDAIELVAADTEVPFVEGTLLPLEVSGAEDVPTPIWKAGLASDGMSKENAVRRVFNVNEE